MTPTADDQGQWLRALSAVLALALAVMAWLFKKAWAGLATKEELRAMEERWHETDTLRDEKLVANALAPIAQEMAAVKADTIRMHIENQDMFREIRDDIKQLLRRD